MDTKLCLYCGKEFIPRKDTQKFCSNVCNSRYYGERNKKYKTCPVCGKQCWCGSSRRVYCSDECKDKIKKPKQAKTKYYCHICGAEIKSRSKFYCCEECRMEYERRRARENSIKDYKPKIFICKVCGTKVITAYGDKRRNICSEDCIKAYESYHKHHSLKHKEKKKSYLRVREKIIQNVTIQKVCYDDLYKRDKGICKICGMPISKNRKINNNWDGTVDHIVPLSCGGEHSNSNCQITHRICNSLKLQEGKEYKINWIAMAKQSNRWKVKLEQYINDMLISGEIRLIDSHFFCCQNSDSVDG